MRCATAQDAAAMGAEQALVEGRPHMPVPGPRLRTEHGAALRGRMARWRTEEM